MALLCRRRCSQPQAARLGLLEASTAACGLVKPVQAAAVVLGSS
jgi:hypothetical protein